MDPVKVLKRIGVFIYDYQILYVYLTIINEYNKCVKRKLFLLIDKEMKLKDYNGMKHFSFSLVMSTIHDYVLLTFEINLTYKH